MPILFQFKFYGTDEEVIIFLSSFIISILGLATILVWFCNMKVVDSSFMLAFW